MLPREDDAHFLNTSGSLSMSICASCRALARVAGSSDTSRPAMKLDTGMLASTDLQCDAGSALMLSSESVLPHLASQRTSASMRNNVHVILNALT